MNALRDFVSEEKREFPVKIGKHVASSLSGFIAGVLVATILWGMALYLARVLQ